MSSVHTMALIRCMTTVTHRLGTHPTASRSLGGKLGSYAHWTGAARRGGFTVCTPTTRMYSSGRSSNPVTGHNDKAGSSAQEAASTPPPIPEPEPGMAVDVAKENLPAELGDPTQLPLERDPSISAYSTGSADILGGGPMVNRVSAFSSAGFVVNERRIKGSVALLPQLRLQWRVSAVEDVTPDALELFTLTTPAIEILVVGTGDRIEMLPREAMKYLKDHNIAVELLATRRACSTYNFLSAEGRHVAAALIPPTS
eukprot:m.176912 g.176912  ORF g.176912 m.176912 type:complete len:256 (-) comp14249_c0_seq1:118-885(-)